MTERGRDSRGSNSSACLLDGWGLRRAERGRGGGVDKRVTSWHTQSMSQAADGFMDDQVMSYCLIKCR